MSNHENLVKEFEDITGTDNERARLFLAAASWRLEVALTEYYDSIGQPVEEVDAHSQSESVERAAAVVGTSNNVHPPSKRIATVASLRRNDSSDDERQAFYTGGSENSGQQVLGPENRNSSGERAFISRLLLEAHEHGEYADQENDSGSSPGSTFSGVGYRLGQTTDDSMIVDASGNESSSGNQREIVLKLWKEGFSVDDGPFREYSNQSNLEFLNKIRRGRLPEELISMTQGDAVHISLEDHSSEQYIPSKKKVIAFSGIGHVLGSPTPSFACDETKKEEDVDTKTDGVTNELVVDPEKPQTMIQVRLADGSRIQINFNCSHTIRDIRKQIEISKPQYSGRRYILMVFPNKELKNDDVTLEEAGILSSCILQVLK